MFMEAAAEIEMHEIDLQWTCLVPQIQERVIIFCDYYFSHWLVLVDIAILEKNNNKKQQHTNAIEGSSRNGSLSMQIGYKILIQISVDFPSIAYKKFAIRTQSFFINNAKFFGLCFLQVYERVCPSRVEYSTENNFCTFWSFNRQNFLFYILMPLSTRVLKTV